MELKNKTKKAVALIELLISLTMASVLMMMLFGIVTKKTRSAITDINGVFYCWKDWDGTLYQKNSTEGIQKVSNCKIKIPKDAKNIQVFLIGGGAGGNRFVEGPINEILSSDSNYPVNSDKDVEYTCIKPNSNNLYTSLYLFNNSTKYNVMTTCESSCSSICTCKLVPSYNKVSEMIVNPSSNSPFDISFITDLFSKGHCYLPVYEKGSIKYVKSSSDMLADELFYVKGSSRNHPCIGKCLINGNEEVCKVDSSQGTCYQDGKIISTNKTYEPESGLTYNSEYNKFNYSYIKSTIGIGEFKEAQAGDFKRGHAEAGKEYTLTADRIGSGGTPGNSGGATYFGNLKANGGTLKATSNIVVNFSKDIKKIASLSELDKMKNISICASSGINCNGSINEQLKEIASDNRIKVSEAVEILPAEFTSKGSWNDDNNIQKSGNDVEKTGFGLFGASAPAVDCAIKYFPFKKFKYNDLNKEISSSNVPKISTCAPETNGMGGAVIIKWD